MKNRFSFVLFAISALLFSSCSNNNIKPTPPGPNPDPKEYEVIETLSKRMPAEFEPVSMVKMCYPNNMPLSVYKTIAEDNKILLLVNPDNANKSRINAA